MMVVSEEDRPAGGPGSLQREARGVGRDDLGACMLTTERAWPQYHLRHPMRLYNNNHPPVCLGTCAHGHWVPAIHLLPLPFPFPP